MDTKSINDFRVVMDDEAPPVQPAGDEASDAAEFSERVGGDSDSELSTSGSRNSRDRQNARSLDSSDYHSWAILGNDQYVASSKTTETLAPGVYRFAYNSQGQLVFMKARVVTDNLFHLADTVSMKVVQSIEQFWNSKSMFQKFGMLYKRGILLYGPAGSGKTVTVTLLANQIIDQGGIVAMCENPETTSRALQTIRRIEADRPIVNIMEDIDTIIEVYGEQAILPLLDGENQVNNIVHVATTNYPERLDARLVNRPSRFDEIRKVGMPAANIRRAYFAHVLPEEFMLHGTTPIPEGQKPELDMWVVDTENMSIAHLRELVVATRCLQRDYKATIERLKSMQKTKPKSGNSNGNAGFAKGEGGVSSGSEEDYDEPED